MENFLKLIKEYKTTKNKKAYLFVLLEKSRKIQFPTYSLIQLLNTISLKPHKIISSEGWIEKDFDLQHQKNIIKKEKAELKKAKSAFEKDKKDNSYLKGSILTISIIAVGLFLFFYVIPNFRSNSEEEMWKNALFENTMASYNNFMRQYPKSKYFVKALEQNRIIKGKLNKVNPLMDSSTISAIKTEKKIPSTDNTKIKQEYKAIEAEAEINDPGIDYQKALGHYYTAREKYGLKDYKQALTFIDLALLYYPDNNQYNKFKTYVEKSLIAQEEKNLNKKVKGNIEKRVDERYKKKTNAKFNQTLKTNVVKATKTENIVKKETFNENVSFAVVEEVPVYPGCKGSNTEKKKCLTNKITKHFNKKYRTGFINKLGLSPGKKRIFVQFNIDKTGKVVSAKAKGPHIRLEEEAVRVAQLLPHMTPGKQNGRNVNVKYTLPITLIVE